MIDLELLDIHPDRTQLILTDTQGQRYSLPITDSLREALRPERPSLQSVKTQLGERAPMPRDIQTLIRMGTTCEEIAEQFSLPIEAIRPYERPILDERRYITRLGQQSKIGSAHDAPLMKDLVVDRLAARGVDPDTITWDALRRGNHPWELVVTFIQSAEEKQAHWQFDPSHKSVTAIDQEAVWLTETAVHSPQETHDVNSCLFPQENTVASLPSPSPLHQSPSPGTTQLLEELNAQRGIRQSIDMSEFDDDADTSLEDSPSSASSDSSLSISNNTDSQASLHHDHSSCAHHEDAHVIYLASSHHSSNCQEQTDDVLPGFEKDTHTATSTPPSSSSTHHVKSKKRRPVPSWDEIVFGSRSPKK